MPRNVPSRLWRARDCVWQYRIWASLEPPICTVDGYRLHYACDNPATSWRSRSREQAAVQPNVASSVFWYLIMDDAPSNGDAPGSQIPSLLRQRMLNRASTFAEGVRPSSPNLPRRRSSLLSNLSDAQSSLRSSTDSLHRTSRNNDMSALAASDDSTWWHSSPVFIAIIPAIAALTHPNGGTIATDLVLLILSAWFLSKCADTPW